MLESDSSLNSSLEDLKISSPVAVKENAKATAMLSSDPARKKSPSLATKRAQSKLLVGGSGVPSSSDPAPPNSAENKKISPSKATIKAKTAANTNTSSVAATSKAVPKLKSVDNPKLASGNGGGGGGGRSIKMKGSLSTTTAPPPPTSTTRAVEASQEQVNINEHFSVHDNDGDEEDEVGSTNSEREDNAS